MKDKSKAKKIISSDGLDIYYWIDRNKESEKLKIIHPGSSMNHSSLDQLESGLFCRNNSTLIFDPRGVGYSDAPTEPKFYSLDKYSNDLQKIIETESLENPEFVTHSFGFMPVADYVSRTSNAKKINGICASYNFSETAQNKFLFHLFDKVLRYSEYVGSAGTYLVRKMIEDERTYPDQSSMENQSGFKNWLSIVDVPFKAIKAHTVSGREINKWDITEQLEKIYAPVLLVYGNKDVMVKPAGGEYIKNHLKGNCEIEIIKGDHFLPITRPDKIIEIVDKYVSS